MLLPTSPGEPAVSASYSLPVIDQASPRVTEGWEISREISVWYAMAERAHYRLPVETLLRSDSLDRMVPDREGIRNGPD